MSATYLIDFENTGNHWAEALAGASEGDQAVLFYTDNSPKAMLDSLEEMQGRGVAVKFKKCEPGRNGLDFQLCSELGCLIGRQGGGSYYIISKDTGYDVLSGYWAASGALVSRICPQEAPAQPAKNAVPGARARAAQALNGPMAKAGLSRQEQAHVIGCAKACLEQKGKPEERMRKFLADTARFKGKKFLDKLNAGVVPALEKLFGGGIS